MTRFLESGTYVPDNTKTVTVWPKPDKDGDGPDLFEDQLDQDGNFLGRNAVLDAQGNQVKEYLPPEGFVHVPTREPGGDRANGAYVKDDGHGRPFRNAQGHAVGIKPGSALVEHADGTHELLTDDFAQVRFRNAHTAVGDSSADDAPADDAQEKEKSA